MECIGIGAQNIAAMVVSRCPIKGSSRRKRLLLRNNYVFGHMWRYSSSSSSSRIMVVQVRCSSTSTTSESCVVDKEEKFADQEDYIRAGGSQLLYVQMQQDKQMDEQSKFSDKVLYLSLHFSSFVSFFSSPFDNYDFIMILV